MAYYLLAQQQEEEEKLTPYHPHDLDQEWEFKIVRSRNINTFEKPEVFARLLDEEAHMGWVFLEKLDGARVRFKRPKSVAAEDARWLKKGLNPYRTVYSPISIKIVPFEEQKQLHSILVFLILLGAFMIMAYLVISAF